MRKLFDILVNSLLDLKVFRSFKVTTTPRWVILVIDVLVVAVSYAVVVAVDYYTSPPANFQPIFVVGWAVLLLVYSLITYLTKNYTCVIRLSAIEDLYRTFVVVALSTLILLAMNLGCSLLTGYVLFSYLNVLITVTLAFSIMMVERLMIKYLYMRMISRETRRKRVLVLGTSISSIILASALKNEIDGNYNPVGLLSIEPDCGGTVNGFRIYPFNPDDVRGIFVEHDIYALIFGATYKVFMRNGFADHFLRNNITLLSINRVEVLGEIDEDQAQSPTNISSFVKEVQIEDLLGREPITLENTLVSNTVRGSCVLITGACGSIGSEIVRQVAGYGAKKIILIDQAETPMHELHLELSKLYPDADMELFMGDVLNKARMELAFSRFHPRFVFHAAAYKHVPMMELNPTEAVLTNVIGTRNIADLALQYGVYKFVMISTDKAVNPTNVMGCTKRLAEIYCQSLFFDANRRWKGTQFITTRFGNVLGSNGSVIPLFRRQIAAGGPVTVTHRDITRYFMTISEACSLVLEAGCMGNGGEVYIFDMGQPVRIYDLAERMISLAGLKPHIDIKIEEVGLRPGEKLYEELLNDKEKTITTDNEKILIARVRTYDYGDVCEHIDQIFDLALQGKEHDMVMAMKRFVPEYKSSHSRFEAVDTELEQANERQSVSN